MFIVVSRHQKPSVILSCIIGRGVGAGVCIVVAGAVAGGNNVVATGTGVAVAGTEVDPGGVV
jgi:phosphoribosylcarboxyaminoimidazole (NCAIR) mutase